VVITVVADRDETGRRDDRRARLVAVVGAVVAIVVAALALVAIGGDVVVSLLSLVGFAAAGYLAGVDHATGTIPNRVALPALLGLLGVAAVNSLARADAQPLAACLVGAAIVGLPFLVISLATNGRGVGGGDVKLALVVGGATGVIDPVVSGLALAASLVFWIILSVRNRQRGSGRTFVLGPALAASGLIALTVAVGLTRSEITLMIESAVLPVRGTVV
jgi:leader peptidase (prepilin peptidase)/N-methyltransferase